MMQISNLEAANMSSQAITKLQVFVSSGVEPSSRSSTQALSSELARVRSTGMTSVPLSHILSSYDQERPR